MSDTKDVDMEPVWLYHRQDVVELWKESVYSRHGDPAVVTRVEELLRFTNDKLIANDGVLISGWSSQYLTASSLYRSVRDGVSIVEAYFDSCIPLPVDDDHHDFAAAEINRMINHYRCSVIANSAYNVIASSADDVVVAAGTIDLADRLVGLLVGGEKFLVAGFLEEAEGYVELGLLTGERVLESALDFITATMALEDGMFFHACRETLEFMVTFPDDVPVAWIVSQLGLGS